MLVIIVIVPQSKVFATIANSARILICVKPAISPFATSNWTLRSINLTTKCVGLPRRSNPRKLSSSSSNVKDPVSPGARGRNEILYCF